MTDLTRKVGVLTSSACGIGRALAQRYTRFEASVVVNYSADQDNAERTGTGVSGADGRAVAERGDVSSSADRTRSFATAIDVFGRLDIVVADAGT